MSLHCDIFCFFLLFPLIPFESPTHPDLDRGSTSGHDSLRLQNANGAGAGWCTGEFLFLNEPVLGGTRHSKFFDCLLDPGCGDPGICCDCVSCRCRPTIPLVGLVPTTVPGAGRTLGNPEENKSLACLNRKNEARTNSPLTVLSLRHRRGRLVGRRYLGPCQRRLLLQSAVLR